jgi:thiol-disulfide isomerase/thioredoxin
MRFFHVSLVSVFVLMPVLLLPQEKAEGPSNEKAQKTYKGALKALQEHKTESALDDFKKADKQDNGHCLACQKHMIKYGVEFGDWKAADLAAEEMVSEAQGQRDSAIAHYQYAVVLVDEGMQKHKDEYFARAHEEIAKALAAHSNFPDALFVDGRALAYLKQDDGAKARFREFVKTKSGDDLDRQRALRYVNRPELARARMAPPFSITSADGKRISMDDLQGKVVLLDFWATWCVPCREALPHIREVAKKFQGQPLVILSVSLDSDEQKWKEFIGKNEMTWLQYREGNFNGPLAKMFAVTAIPHTFTIDADGVLQEEHIGDASVEGKLKKLLVHAREVQSTETPAKKEQASEF